MSWARVAAGEAKPKPTLAAAVPPAPPATLPVPQTLSSGGISSANAEPTVAAVAAAAAPAAAAAAAAEGGEGGEEAARTRQSNGDGGGGTISSAPPPPGVEVPVGVGGGLGSAAPASVGTTAGTPAAPTAGAGAGTDGEAAPSTPTDGEGAAAATEHLGESAAGTPAGDGDDEEGESRAAVVDPAAEAAAQAAQAAAKAEAEAKAAEDAAALAERVWKSLLQMLGREDGLAMPAAPGLGLGLPAGGLVHRGLVNTGNSCFRNAVLQALLACEPFVE